MARTPGAERTPKAPPPLSDPLKVCVWPHHQAGAPESLRGARDVHQGEGGHAGPPRWPHHPVPPVSPRVVSSWIERRKVQSEKANLMILFDKYLPTCLDKLRFGFKKITPIPEVTVIQTILYLLECLLTEKSVPPDSPKELYELYFVFACFWAFGGAMFQDQVSGRPPPPPRGASRPGGASGRP